MHGSRFTFKKKNKEKFKPNELLLLLHVTRKKGMTQTTTVGEMVAVALWKMFLLWFLRNPFATLSFVGFIYFCQQQKKTYSDGEIEISPFSFCEDDNATIAATVFANWSSSNSICLFIVQ